MKPKPKTKPTPKTSDLHSVNSLSRLTGKDRRTLDKLLAGVEPSGTKGTAKLYRLSDVESAIKARGGAAGLRDQKLAEEIRKLRISNDAKERVLVPRARVDEVVLRIASRVDAILEQKLVNEWPAGVVGKSVPEARLYGQRLGDAIRDEFRALHIEWR